jgi:hypothetical protein
MLKLKVKSKGKEYPIHMHPAADRIDHCLEAIQKVMQYAIYEKNIADKEDKTQRFYAMRDILSKLDDLGYYTDL